MKNRRYFFYTIAILAGLIIAGNCFASSISLPNPQLKGKVSVEEALAKRRSIRSYANDPLGLKEVSQLLWATQGITAKGGKKTAPSAGAIYPLQLYLVAGSVEGLDPGVYQYNPDKNELTLKQKGDLRSKLMAASMMQPWVKQAPITIIFGINYTKMGRYTSKSKMYADFEVGHAAQNLMLQAVALGLGTVAIGAFNKGEVETLLKISRPLEVVYLIPVGKPK